MILVVVREGNGRAKAKFSVVSLALKGSEISVGSLLQVPTPGRVGLRGPYPNFKKKYDLSFDATFHYDIGLQMKVRLLHCVYLNFKLADSLLEFRILQKHFRIVFGSMRSLKF